MPFFFFFLVIFNIINRFWAAQSFELEVHYCWSSGFPFVVTKIVRDQFYQLNVCKSMGCDRIHPKVLL